jgi:hypothetical protein
MFYSLGGLGKDNSLACVSDVFAEHINVENALYGVRIKTWQVKKDLQIQIHIVLNSA